MYSEKIQLELLDEIANAERPHRIDKIDLTDPQRKWNYDFLVRELFLHQREKRVGSGYGNDPQRLHSYAVELNPKGEQRRFELREKHTKENEQRRVNEDVTATRIDTAKIRRMTWFLLLIALAGLAVSVAMFFRCSQSADGALPRTESVEEPEPAR